MTGYEPSEALVTCSCTHLTTFSCPLVPPIIIADWQLLTFANLVAEPTGLIVIGTLTAVMMLVAGLASLQDEALDELGIAKMCELINRDLDALKSHDDEEYEGRATMSVAQRRKTYTSTGEMSSRSLTHWFSKRSHQGLLVLLRKHSWLSIYGRHPSSTVGCVDRVWILYNCLLVSSACSAMFIEANGIAESAGVWFYCCLISILTTVVQYKLCFQPSNYRFHDLFLSHAEECVQRLHPGHQLDDGFPGRRQVTFQLFKEGYNFEPGVGQSKYFIRWLLMGFKYIDDYPAMDMRASRSSLLRQKGLEVIYKHCTFDAKELTEKWKQKNYQSSRRYFGYFSIVLSSVGFGTLLLVYMLQFQLTEDPSEAQTLWFGNWWKGTLTDVLTSPSILILQFISVMRMWNQMMPVDKALSNRAGLDKAALSLYQKSLRSSETDMLPQVEMMNLDNIDTTSGNADQSATFTGTDNNKAVGRTPSAKMLDTLAHI